MKLLFLIYVICLFIIFTPGIFFSIFKKNKVANIVSHGLLFALVFYLSSLMLNKKIVEGNTYTLNINDLSDLFNSQQTVDSVQGQVVDPSENNDSPEVKMAKKNNDAINRVKKEITGENKTLVASVKKEVDKMKNELTNYKFNPSKTKFICLF